MKQSLFGKWAACGVLGFALAGCTQYDNEPLSSTAEEEENETTRFGSATDVIENGPTPTNPADRADIGIGGPVAREAGNFESQPLPRQKSDEELAKQIRVALTTGSLGTTGALAENQLTRIQVSVENGVVTLTGPVTSEDEKKIIGQRVADLAGVREIRNQLTPGGRSVEDVPLNPIVPRSGED